MSARSAIRTRCMSSASAKPTRLPTTKPANASRSEYHAAETTAEPTVDACAAPATSGSPKAPKMSARCGIEASSVRGRTSVSPIATPSSGMTAL
jgi:hypothetical protein